MASFQKRSGSWRAVVRLRGAPAMSATFSTKAEAQAWAARTETAVRDGKAGRIPDKCFGDLLLRYRDEVSATKRGERWERVRIERLVLGRDSVRDAVPADALARVRLADLSAADFAAWRDRRLREVSAASVRREWTLLSHACSVAVKEWRWLIENPMTTVRRPPPAKARDRRIEDTEVERLRFAMGYAEDAPPWTATARVAVAFLLAIETAMRAGELCALRWADVDVSARVARVAGHAGAGKTDAARRSVALSPRALELVELLRAVTLDSGLVLDLRTSQVDALFRKAKAMAMIEDLHFHDTRHEAITRLAKKIGVLDLARMVGHRDLRQLMVYYNETASEIAEKLK